MKRIIVVLFALAICCQIVFSQYHNKGVLKSADMRTDDFKVSLSSRNAGDVLKTRLNISDDYDFKIQIIKGTKDQTVEKDDLIRARERYAQYYKGIRVDDSDIRMHYYNETLVFVNGKYIDAPNIDLTVAISKEVAIQKATEYVGAKTFMWEDEAEHNWWASIAGNGTTSLYPNAELVISKNRMDVKDSMVYLAYKIDVFAKEPLRHDYIYVDAKTGKILAVIPILISATGTAQTRYSGPRTISSQLIGNIYHLKDYSRGSGIETYNVNNSNTFHPLMQHAVDFTSNSADWVLNTANKDNGALDAHWGAMMAYDYFFKVHKRNSIDNNGKVFKSYVHFGTNSNEAGWHEGFNFAYYSDGHIQYDILTSLDIVAHEFAHGVTNFTAGLKYSGESGAINESLSDIWGACVQNYAASNKNIWLIGDEVSIFPRLLLRNMSNPGLSDPPQPETYGAGPNWQGTNADVHHNSGIMNHWFYILSVGKTGYNDLLNYYSVAGIGIDKAAKIVYAAHTKYLGYDSNFADARNYTIAVADSLYGPISSELIAVTNAWYAVGVGAKYVAPAISINGGDVICYNGSSVTLTNPPSQMSTIYWEVTGPFSFSSSSIVTKTSGNPITVYKTSASGTTGTLSARSGSASNTVFISKAITTCPPPTISGFDLICASATYSISNLPSTITGSQVIWTCSSNLTLQGGSTGLTKQFNKTSAGYGWVKASIAPLSNLTLQKNVLVSYPVGSEFHQTEAVSCGNTIHMEPYNAGVTNYRWAMMVGFSDYTLWNSTNSSWIWQNGPDLYAQLRNNGIWVFYAYAITDCGESPSQNHEFAFNIGLCRSSGISFAYPNPVSDILTVDLDSVTEGYAPEQSPSDAQRFKPDPAYDVRLYDGQGNLLRQQKAKGGTVQFNVSSLPVGIHYLHIYDEVNTTPIMEAIVVEH